MVSLLYGAKKSRCEAGFSLYLKPYFSSDIIHKIIGTVTGIAAS